MVAIPLQDGAGVVLLSQLIGAILESLVARTPQLFRFSFSLLLLSVYSVYYRPVKRISFKDRWDSRVTAT
jgi:hypothetical protein